MKLEKGNMWSVYDKTDLFLITTNSFIKKDGRLVMGAGIAKQARDRFKDINIDMAFGMAVEDACGHLGEYGLIVSEYWPLSKMGLFQVKHHWKNKAELDLVKLSTRKLIEFIEKYDGAILRVDLNYPAIGNGKLTKAQVEPIISQLPDKVHLWEFGR